MASRKRTFGVQQHPNKTRVTSDSASHEAKALITLQNQTQSPLFRLPAEVRITIFTFVLDNGVIDVCASKKCRTESPDAYGVDVEDRTIAHAHYPRDRFYLLQVCQQAYTEARFLAFSLNVLKGDVENIREFLWGSVLNLEGSVLSFEQKSAIKVAETNLWLMDVCLLDGCISGEVDRSILGDFERVYLLLGLEKLLIHYTCQEPRHQTSKKFGIKAKASIKKAIGPIGKNARVEFIDGLSDSSRNRSS